MSKIFSFRGPSVDSETLHLLCGHYTLEEGELVGQFLSFYALLFRHTKWVAIEDAFGASLWATLTGLPQLSTALSNALEDTEETTANISHASLPLEGCLERWKLSMESFPYTSSQSRLLETPEINGEGQPPFSRSRNTHHKRSLTAAIDVSLSEALAEEIDVFLRSKSTTIDAALPHLVSSATTLLWLRPGEGVHAGEDLLSKVKEGAFQGALNT